MINILILIFYYFFILLSILGYGIYFLKIFEKRIIRNNFGYVGLFGLYTLLIYSYLSNFIIAHSELHNLILLAIGFILFFLNCLKNYSEYQKSIFLTFIVFALISSSLFLLRGWDMPDLPSGLAFAFCFAAEPNSYCCNSNICCLFHFVLGSICKMGHLRSTF